MSKPRKQRTRRCDYCGGPMGREKGRQRALRSDAKYDSASCRVLARRERLREEGPARTQRRATKKDKGSA